MPRRPFSLAQSSRICGSLDLFSLIKGDREESLFAAAANMLANKNDAHSIKVFDPSIKGDTNRFVYRFVKL
jgi:hypothetical protein